MLKSCRLTINVFKQGEKIEKEDFNRIMLEVNENNNEAIKLYTKLGFKEISFRERYYEGYLCKRKR